jgi:hypothetical protein
MLAWIEALRTLLRRITMRLFISALLVCSASGALAQGCNSTDMRENMKWCTINPQFAVKSAFCRELKQGQVDGAIGSMDDCQRGQGDHDKIMNNARACGN